MSDSNSIKVEPVGGSGSLGILELSIFRLFCSFVFVNLIEI